MFNILQNLTPLPFSRSSADSVYVGRRSYVSHTVTVCPSAFPSYNIFGILAPADSLLLLNSEKNSFAGPEVLTPAAALLLACRTRSNHGSQGQTAANCQNSCRNTGIVRTNNTLVTVFFIYVITVTAQSNSKIWWSCNQRLAGLAHI